jgi:hypothetical protein
MRQTAVEIAEGGAAFSTSPRVRGEVGAERRVRGPLRESELAENSA